MKTFECVEGGVTAACGFQACGVEAGIKYPGRKDMALLVADAPAAVAAVYTTNKVEAAPVQVDRVRTRTGQAQAVVAAWQTPREVAFTAIGLDNKPQTVKRRF